MNWIEVVTIIGSLGGIMFFLVNKIDSDLKSMGSRLDGHAQRIYQLYHMSNAKHDAQMARIDQLYKMFVDLLKEKK